VLPLLAQAEQMRSISLEKTLYFLSLSFTIWALICVAMIVYGGVRSLQTRDDGKLFFRSFGSALLWWLFGGLLLVVVAGLLPW
jgi:hypothetical protein